ncbi:hypothetical protein GW932_02810 [archaeon]|nr:hypothetical protein [archaeon]
MSDQSFYLECLKELTENSIHLVNYIKTTKDSLSGGNAIVEISTISGVLNFECEPNIKAGKCGWEKADNVITNAFEKLIKHKTALLEQENNVVKETDQPKLAPKSKEI